MTEVVSVEKATRTKDRYGAYKDTWETIIPKAHAKVTYGHSGTNTSAGDTAPSSSVTFQMRYTDKIAHNMRILWQGRHYRVSADPQRYRQRGEIDVTAELIDE